VLEAIAASYGHPEEVADAYRATEATCARHAGHARPPANNVWGKIFGVFTDFRTYTSLFLALLALPTGILYFTVAVTGLAISAGTSILIFGLPSS